MQFDDAPTGTEPAQNEQEKVVKPIKEEARALRGGWGVGGGVSNQPSGAGGGRIDTDAAVNTANALKS